MIVLDTHVWVWWVHQDDRLSTKAKSFISQQMDQRILSYPHVPLARVD